jgi:hypothetical protein
VRMPRPLGQSRRHLLGQQREGTVNRTNRVGSASSSTPRTAAIRPRATARSSHIEQPAPAIRHREIRRVKATVSQDTMLRFVDRLADTPKSRYAVGQGVNRGSGAPGIGTASRMRDTHRDASELRNSKRGCL